MQLARPEAKQLGVAVALVSSDDRTDLELTVNQLLVSSSVSMLVPLTIGKVGQIWRAHDRQPY